MSYGEELLIEPFAHPNGEPDGFLYDGGNVNTKTGAFYFGLMRFCGCGCPEEAVALVRDALDGPPRDWSPDQPAPLGHAELSAIIAANPDRAAWFVLYALDSWEFTEHGSSLTGGGWLTSRGKQAVEVFRADDNNPTGDTD